MKRYNLVYLLLVIVLLGGASLGSAATFHTSVSYSGEVDWSTNDYTFPLATDEDTSSSAAESALNPTSSLNTIDVYARSSPGKLRARVDLALGGWDGPIVITPDPDGGIGRGLDGAASASFEDSVTVNAPGLMNQSGLVSFTMVVSGNLATSLGRALGGSYATWFVGGSGAFTSDPVNGAQILPSFEDQYSGEVPYEEVSGNSNYNVVPNGTESPERTSYGSNAGGSTVLFELPIYFGQPFTFGLTLDVTAGLSMSPDGIGYPGSDTRLAGGIAYGDYGNTAEIFITGVADSMGTPLDSDAYSLVSDSGFTYAIPEPGVFALLGLGGLLGFALRRRQ